jgi:gliding motility-associated-like protein
MLCAGDTLTLNASATAGAPVSWLPLYNILDETHVQPRVFPQVDTFYMMKVMLGSTCAASDTMRVMVKARPVVDGGPDIPFCREMSVSAGVSFAGADSFFWSPAAGISDVHAWPAIIELPAAGAYVVRAIDRSTGCWMTDTVALFDVRPVASFTVDVKEGQEPLKVAAINTSQNAHQHVWLVNDSFVTAAESVALELREGKHLLWLIAENSGCLDTAYEMITVSGNLVLLAPNVFTPNGDGINDVFAISCTPGSIRSLRLTIWDRWGERIYTSELPGGKWWDGNVDGEPAQQDVYVFRADAEDRFGNRKVLKGNVTLLR